MDEDKMDFEPIDETLISAFKSKVEMEEKETKRKLTQSEVVTQANLTQTGQTFRDDSLMDERAEEDSEDYYDDFNVSVRLKKRLSLVQKQFSIAPEVKRWEKLHYFGPRVKRVETMDWISAKSNTKRRIGPSKDFLKKEVGQPE